jgi:hypothetical protein
MPPAGVVAKTHELRYVFLDFDTAVDAGAAWLTFANRCARANRPVAKTSAVRLLEFVVNGEDGSPITARLLCGGTHARWLEFDGATWTSRDMAQATSAVLRTWPH